MNLYFLLFFAANLFGFSANAFATTHFATPNGGKVYFDGKSRQTSTLKTAIKRAKPGDEVVLLPGTYNPRLTISKKSTPGKPITIRSYSDGVHINCNQLPAKQGEPAFKFSLVEHLIIKNLSIKNCWPHAIVISDSRFVTLANNDIVGSKSAILVRHQGSHHIRMINNRWTQNLHSRLKKVPSDRSRGDFSGAMVELDNVSGAVHIENNQVTDANSLLMLQTSVKEPLLTTNINLHHNQLKDIEHAVIVKNTTVDNMWFHHNIIEKTMNLLTVEKAHLGDVYLFANTINNPVGEQVDEIFSSTSSSSIKNRKIYIFNNTFHNIANFGNFETAPFIFNIQNNIFQFRKKNFSFFSPQKKDLLNSNIFNLPHKNMTLHRSYQLAEVKFKDTKAGNFTRTDDSHAPRASKALPFIVLGKSFRISDHAIGAHNSKGMVKGPDFRNNSGGRYGEFLNLRDFHYHQNQLTLRFNRPLTRARIMLETPVLTIHQTALAPLDVPMKDCRLDGAELSCYTKIESVVGAKFLISKIFFPTDKDDRPLYWAHPQVFLK